MTARSLSVSVTVGKATSAVLPETAAAPTMLVNTVPGSSGPINLSVNGSDTRVLQNVDPKLLTRAEDVTVGIIVGSPRQGTRPLDDTRGIPVMSEGNEANLSAFLSDGVSELNTDIDIHSPSGMPSDVSFA